MTSSDIKKLVTLVGVGVVSSVFWLLAKNWIVAPTRFSDFHVWFEPLLFLVIISALIGLAFVLLPGRKWSAVLAVIFVGAYMLIFGFGYYYLLQLIIASVLFFYGQKRVKQELVNNIKIDIYDSILSGLKAIMPAILIMISFAFFLSPNIQASANSRQLPPTVKQVIETTVNNFLGSQLDQLPPQQRQATKNQIVSQVFEQFNNSLRPYFHFLPPILAFGLFLVLESLSFVFIWLAAALAWLIFRLLRVSGVVSIKTRQVTAEEIVI